MNKIIQLMHSGREHSRDRNSDVNGKMHKNWNSGKHKRKFCKAKGDYIDKDNNNHKDEDIMLWCEWEPPSFVEKTYAKQACMPKWLHEPYLPIDSQGRLCPTGTKTQNTDPCIFGEYFKYFICLQEHFKVLTKLNNGDLILFGSSKNKKFLIDTVFVVDEVIDVSMVEPEYDYIAISRVGGAKHYTSSGAKLYKGKTFAPGEIYSFVPASKDYFCRISVPHDSDLMIRKYICPCQTRGITYEDNVDQNTLVKVWNELKNLTLNQGLVLAHKIQWPSRIPVSTTGSAFPAGSSTTGCRNRKDYKNIVCVPTGSINSECKVLNNDNKVEKTC